MTEESEGVRQQLPVMEVNEGAAVVEIPIDDRMETILRKSLANPSGKTENQLYDSNTGKEWFLKTLHIFEKAGAVIIIPKGKQKKIVTPNPIVINKILADGKLSYTDAVGSKNIRPSQKVLLPAWFKTQCSIAQHIEKMILEMRMENQPKMGDRSVVIFRNWLGHALLDSADEMLGASSVSELSSPRAKSGILEHISRNALKGAKDPTKILMYLLYEIRASILMKSYDYLVSQRDEIERERWWRTRDEFYNEWMVLTKRRFSGSIEKWLPHRVFIDFICRNGFPKESGIEYIRLMYDAAKWCTLDRMSYSKFFFDEYRKRLKLCDTSAEDLAKKAQDYELISPDQFGASVQ